MMLSYLLHMRPRSWPIVAGHLATGYMCGAAVADGDVSWRRLAVAAFGWAVLLNGGTLALNSAFDKDTGAIGYLEHPPPVPRGLAMFGAALLALGLLPAATISTAYLTAYITCTGMSALYSCPPVRLKAVPFADLAINCGGYGALTFYGGWAAAGAPLGMPGSLSVVGFFMLFGGLYPLTQIYQIETDAAGGDRTLAVFLGRRRSLWLSAGFTAAAFACFAAGVTGGSLWRFVALLPGGLFWCILLAAWLAGALASREKEGMYKALYAWALTDIGLVIALNV